MNKCKQDDGPQEHRAIIRAARRRRNIRPNGGVGQATRYPSERGKPNGTPARQAARASRNDNCEVKKKSRSAPQRAAACAATSPINRSAFKACGVAVLSASAPHGRTSVPAAVSALLAAPERSTPNRLAPGCLGLLTLVTPWAPAISSHMCLARPCMDCRGFDNQSADCPLINKCPLPGETATGSAASPCKNDDSTPKAWTSTRLRASGSEAVLGASERLWPSSANAAAALVLSWYCTGPLLGLVECE